MLPGRLPSVLASSMPCAVAAARAGTDVKSAGGCAVQCSEGGAQDLNAVLVVQFPRLAQTDQQHALGGDAGKFVQQQRGCGFAAHVAACDEVAERMFCGLVQ